jgi:hypothetical protein
MRRFLTQTADTLATRTSHQLGPIGRDDGDDDAAFGQKLFALIRDLFWSTSHPPHGGAASSEETVAQTRSMSGVRDVEKVEVTIDRAEGWEFAFEGGAHILFRHVRKDVRFVRPPADTLRPHLHVIFDLVIIYFAST